MQDDRETISYFLEGDAAAAKRADPQARCEETVHAALDGFAGSRKWQGYNKRLRGNQIHWLGQARRIDGPIGLCPSFHKSFRMRSVSFAVGSYALASHFAPSSFQSSIKHTSRKINLVRGISMHILFIFEGLSRRPSATEPMAMLGQSFVTAPW